jgi:transcriptional regulator with XRE-family HTH domain
MDDIHPLRAYRERQRLSQQELADRLDVDKSTVWRWETGKRKIDEEKIPLVAGLTGIAPRALRPDLAQLLRRPESV